MAVEVLRGRRPPIAGEAILQAVTEAIQATGERVVESSRYVGGREWLMLFGVGAASHHPARDRHVVAGGKVLMWDMGYFGRGRAKVDGYLRCTIDRDHPQHLLDRAPVDTSRLDAHSIRLREDADPKGHVVLVGLGKKQRAYLGNPGWEERKFAELCQRFPGRRILYRPKKADDTLALPCSRDGVSPIEDVLRGAALVVCKHSNVAVDATIAGVPFEAEDGAAMWLTEREYTPPNRLEFLRRLAWFQWHPSEADEAWAFIRSIA